MDIKKAYSLTFSPTGGTKKIAEHIASAVCERSEFLDVTVKAQDTDFGAEDFVVIAVPVFGGRVPSPVAERLSHVSAQNTPAAIVAVYGNRAYEDALLELRGMAEARGFKVMAAGAFIARHEIMDTLQSNPTLGHITTFGGHPVCCAAGLAALEYLLDHHVVEQVEAKGALYEELLQGHPAVREIRRSGLLLAVELGSSERLYRIMELFKQAGIMSDWFLFCDTAFRISPPLTISEEEVRDSARIILECLDRL